MPIILYADYINPTALFYLICWPDEDNTMSVVPGHKIISPSVEESVPGSFCKIKRFEKHLSKIEAAGTEAEMNKRLHKEGNSEPDESESPRKRARKENQTMPKIRKGIQKKTVNKEGKYEHVHVCITISKYTCTCKQVLYAKSLYNLITEKKIGAIIVVGSTTPPQTSARQDSHPRQPATSNTETSVTITVSTRTRS